MHEVVLAGALAFTEQAQDGCDAALQNNIVVTDDPYILA